MSSRIESFFSETDRDAIRAATVAAEQTSSGELVTYVVERCDPHPEVAWKGALIGAGLGAAGAALAIYLFGGWGAPDGMWLVFGLQLGVVAGWLASRLEVVARFLIGDEALMSRVEGRAAEAFVEEEVFATRGRTGVLIFVALFEHRVLILTDRGIRERVPEDAWKGLATRLASGIRAGTPAAALQESIQRCARILEEHGIPANVENELANEPRFRDA